MIKFGKELTNLAHYFEKSGARLYVVGGAVRNYLLKEKITDIDITSSLSLDDVMQALDNTEFLVKIKNALTQTAQILYYDKVFEYACFRREEYDALGDRVPSKIEKVLTPKEDYVRRDFTCNALYYDVLTGEILDFCNGLSDIQNKILNTPQKPEQTLSYDALRLLRLIRFSLYYNLNIAEGVEKEAKKNAYNMLKIKGQIKKEELLKIITFGTNCKNFYDANFKKLYMLLSYNLIPYLFSTKLKKIDFNVKDISKIFPLSLNCNNPKLALTCFILDLYAYILSKQIYIDKEIIELLLSSDGFALSNKEISYYTKLASAYTFDKIISQTRFYIYLNNEIIDDVLSVFNFNSNYKIVIKTIKDELKAIKHKKLPLKVSDLKITGKDIFDAKLNKTSNINFMLKQIHYAVLFEHIKNDKQSIISFILKKFK